MNVSDDAATIGTATPSPETTAALLTNQGVWGGAEAA